MNDRPWQLLVADAEKLPFSDGSVDLVLGSPPYCDARTYGIGAQRGCAEWVEWMLRVTDEAMRVSRGPVVWIAAGVTRDRNYWPACEGLMWEWWKRGGDCQLYRPCYWHRIGIPGSGGDDWFRADVEYCMCFKRPGPLPWSDNTALGHAPRWAPGGSMSHRVSDGTRVNQWGHSYDSGTGTTRGGNGELAAGKVKPSHRLAKTRKLVNRCQRNGDGKQSIRGDEVQEYYPPAKANPGTMPSLNCEDESWVIRARVGGGMLGHEAAHANEAPMPERLAEFFIRSLCPPGGTVLDCVCGSGTTVAVAYKLGRRGIGTDIRQSQIDIAKQRMDDIGHPLFEFPGMTLAKETGECHA